MQQKEGLDQELIEEVYGINPVEYIKLKNQKISKAQDVKCENKIEELEEVVEQAEDDMEDFFAEMAADVIQ